MRLLFSIGVSLLTTFPLMWLWNYVMPEAMLATFWQVFVMNVLGGIVLGSASD